MFENDYTINGKHATYLKFLVSDAKIFNRYVDVYMVAAIFGFLLGRRESKDTVSQDRARIYADAFANERLSCDFIYRLIMLLDETANLNTQQRVDRAFREDTQKGNDKDNSAHAKNMELFHSYVLGGIEELYEQFTNGSTTREDYINRIFDVCTNFKNEVDGINYEEKIKEFII